MELLQPVDDNQPSAAARFAAVRRLAELLPSSGVCALELDASGWRGIWSGAASALGPLTRCSRLHIHRTAKEQEEAGGATRGPWVRSEGWRGGQR